MKFPQILFLITPLSTALATPPILTDNDDAVPALLAPRQNIIQNKNPACKKWVQSCEETWGKLLRGNLPKVGLCKCVANSKKTIMCSSTYPGCWD
ncbi:hypothetical protein Vi05172_g1512 [Venturia inaequalis]|nr:hypothetical protein Vi05172_g1512 [Venturia inaequalis]